MPPKPFTTHPLIKALRGKAGKGPLPRTTRLAGYIGGVEGKAVRLHASLDEPSRFLTVNRADVLHVADAPAEVRPGGGVYLWVKDGAVVHVGGVKALAAEAKYLSGNIRETRMVGDVERPIGLPRHPTNGTTTCTLGPYLVPALDPFEP